MDPYSTNPFVPGEPGVVYEDSEGEYEYEIVEEVVEESYSTSDDEGEPRTTIVYETYEIDASKNLGVKEGGSSLSSAVETAPIVHNSIITETMMEDYELKAYPPSDAFVITMGDFEKGKGYVTYKIHVKTTLDQYLEKDFITVRRYSDFEWLHSKLAEKHVDVIIPPLPEKNYMDRFETSFIEYRRRALERFLQRVTDHPILQTSETLQLFLEIEAEIFSSTKSTSKTKGWATSKRKCGDEIDDWFESKRMYICTLESQLNVMLKETAVFLQKQKDFVASREGFLKAALSVGSVEREADPKLASLWNSLSEVVKQIRVLEGELNDHETIYFEESLKDYQRLLLAAKVTLENRLVALGSYQAADKNLQTKKARAEKLQGSPKAVKLEAEIVAQETKVEELRDTYNDITITVRREIENFEAVKGREIAKALQQVVKANMDIEVQVTDTWKSLLNKIQGTYGF